MTPTITLTRPGTPETGPEQYDLDIAWVVERRWPVITCAWCEGEVFALSDKEIEELEERIYYSHEDEINGY
jgi:hypothetical protein